MFACLAWMSRVVLSPPRMAAGSDWRLPAALAAVLATAIIVARSTAAAAALTASREARGGDRGIELLGDRIDVGRGPAGGLGVGEHYGANMSDGILRDGR